MTKQEYIKSRCDACGLCDGSEYHQYHCPIVDEIDSAWDASRKQAADIGWEWIAEDSHTFDPLKESFYKAMEE